VLEHAKRYEHLALALMAALGALVFLATHLRDAGRADPTKVGRTPTWSPSLSQTTPADDRRRLGSPRRLYRRF
jgi:hypothetical protein